MEELKQKLRKFAKARDWDQFHSPKNLAMAMSVEASELLEHFQWLTQEESKKLDAEKLEAIKQEIGDVLLYLNPRKFVYTNKRFSTKRSLFSLQKNKKVVSLIFKTINNSIVNKLAI
jgi:hypothetical protein